MEILTAKWDEKAFEWEIMTYRRESSIRNYKDNHTWNKKPGKMLVFGTRQAKPAQVAIMLLLVASQRIALMPA